MARTGVNIFTTLRQLPRIVKSAIVERRFRGELAAVPRFSLAEFPEDTRGRISGIARPFGAALEAPLSGRPCVYYHITIAEIDAGSVRELVSEQDAVRFILDDGGHRAVIDPGHARISAEFDHETTSKAAFDANIAQHTLLERHSLIKRNWFSTDAVLYREAIIEIDEPIVVVGIGTWEPDLEAMPTGIYREANATRLWLSGSARFPLVISDDPTAR